MIEKQLTKTKQNKFVKILIYVYFIFVLGKQKDVYKNFIKIKQNKTKGLWRKNQNKTNKNKMISKQTQNKIKQNKTKCLWGKTKTKVNKTKQMFCGEKTKQNKRKQEESFKKT